MTAAVTAFGLGVDAIRAQQLLDAPRIAAIPGIQLQITAIQAQLLLNHAQLAAVLAALGGGSTQQRISIAMASNKHSDDLRDYVVVPTPAGITPPNWPNGFNRVMLRTMQLAALDLLLLDYGLPQVGLISVRRKVLAHHIGTGGF